MVVIFIFYYQDIAVMLEKESPENFVIILKKAKRTLIFKGS